MTAPLRMRFAMQIYAVAIRTMPAHSRYAHYALIAFGEAKLREIIANGLDPYEEAQKLLNTWRTRGTEVGH